MNFDPKVGPTGSKVTSCSLNVESGDELVQKVFAPRPPERVVEEYDEDGYVICERELTDVEFAAAKKAYKKAKAEWDRTGKASFVKMHPDVIEVSVECADRTRARGVWNAEEKAWKWVEWCTIGRVG